MEADSFFTFFMIKRPPLENFSFLSLKWLIFNFEFFFLNFLELIFKNYKSSIRSFLQGIL